MILRRIALEHWRCFEREHTVELLPGLNVIHGANEAGKSTILEALTRAFYEKHRAGGAEIAAIQPLGRSVAPRVTVEFERGGTSYRIEKRFLKRQTSELSRFDGLDWRVIADGDDADHEVRDLVHGGERGRERVLSPEARGLAQALWLLQRDQDDLPKDWAPQVRQGLGAIAEDAAETREAGRFASALERQYLEWFTPTGVEKKGGPLAHAREAERLAHEDVAALNNQERAVQELRSRLEAQEDNARLLENEARHHDLTVEQAFDAAAGADTHEKAHDAVQRERKDAREASQALAKTLEELRGRQRRSDDCRAELLGIERESRRADEESKAQNAARLKALTQVVELRERLQVVRLRYEALETALRRRTKLDQIEALRCALDEIVGLRNEVREKSERLAGLAAPDSNAKLAFDQADRELATARAARQASGIAVRFALAGAGVISASPMTALDEEGRYLLTRETTFDLGSWGSITVGGGGESVASLDARIERHEAERSALLGDLTPEEFLRRYLQGEEIRRDLQNCIAGLEALERKHPRVESQLSFLRTEASEEIVHASTLEQGWEFLEASALEAARKAAFAERQVIESELSSAETRERIALQKVTELTAEANKAQAHRIRKEAEIEHEDRECAGILRQYGNQDALLEAVEKASGNLDSCETRLKELEDLYWVRVEAPRQQAQRALDKQQELRGRVEEAERAARDTRMALRQEIKEGFHERLAEAEERLHGLFRQREVAERRGRSLRLLHELYGKRKEAQGQTLRAPVARLVGPWLRLVTDERYAGLEMDERLMPTGLCEERGGGVSPLDALSQGTREQTVLLVRLALARLVADERPFPVILDDRLVNADRIRMDRMGLILRQIAEMGQLVVATCDPTRYDGLGAHMIRL